MTRKELVGPRSAVQALFEVELQRKFEIESATSWDMSVYQDIS